MPYKRSSGVSESRSNRKGKRLRGPVRQQDERRVQRSARAKQRKRRAKIEGVS